ncbi:hypothetical protein [Cysteiniphilum sp. 6C5]|uniref:hypothetical protein n=1 Tax=unclassified Cysteiniphilum TaxID=2610889 RepID=UPI003F855F60
MSKYCPHDKPYIEYDTELAALKRLVGGKPTRIDLAADTQRLNSPDVILNLRKHGWDISTYRHYYRKSNGKLSWTGRYTLSKAHQAYALKNILLKK